jgi:hypothetical protein
VLKNLVSILFVAVLSVGCSDSSSGDGGFEGRFVNPLMQHPLLNDPDSRQIYFRPTEYQFGEWIVIVPKSGPLYNIIRDVSNKKVSISGRVENVEMGGVPNSKGGYKNRVIYLEKIERLE